METLEEKTTTTARAVTNPY